MTDLLEKEDRMTSFEEYAKTKNLKRTPPSATTWFKDHADIGDQCVAARADGWTWQQIHNWLKDEHEFPLASPTGLRKWMTGQ